MSNYYNQPDRPVEDKEIKYLNKDFTGFKNQLMEFSKVYFPDTFNDFSDASPGQVFIEMAAYVGDVLSFSIDNQLKEHFLSTAAEKENIFEASYLLGYTPRISIPSSAEVDLYQLVPSIGSGYTPDFSFAFNLKANSTFEASTNPLKTREALNNNLSEEDSTLNDGTTLSNNGNVTTFILEEDVDFAFSSSFSPTDIQVYEYDGNDNPRYYLLKKKGKVTQGSIQTKTFNIGEAVKFNELSFEDNKFIRVISLIDSDGNSWYNVPYLGQETIYEEIINKSKFDQSLYGFSNETPSLLRLKKVPRRYAVRVKDGNNINLLFGSGISTNADEEIIPNPDNVGLGISTYGLTRLNYSFDPSNFLFTRTYGLAPSNTNLTLKYLKGGGTNSNVPSNTINKPGILNIVFKDVQSLDSGMVDFIKGTFAVNNPSPATGGKNGDTIEEIRQNAIANFATQQRTVTKEDYLIRTLSLPPKFGSVAKAYIIQDQQINSNTDEVVNNPLALNLYILAYNLNKQLTTANKATKENLKLYLDQNRLMTDSINIKDAFIVNFGIKFEIVSSTNFNSNEVLFNCINALKEYFIINKMQINRPIIISEVYTILYKVKGVLNVNKLEFTNKSGGNYSRYKYGMKGATRDNIIYPSLDPMCFEIKFPNNDIEGKIVTTS